MLVLFNVVTLVWFSWTHEPVTIKSLFDLLLSALSKRQENRTQSWLTSAATSSPATALANTSSGTSRWKWSSGNKKRYVETRGGLPEPQTQASGLSLPAGRTRLSLISGESGGLCGTTLLDCDLDSPDTPIHCRERVCVDRCVYIFRREVNSR